MQLSYVGSTLHCSCRKLETSEGRVLRVGVYWYSFGILLEVITLEDVT